MYVICFFCEIYWCLPHSGQSEPICSIFFLRVRKSAMVSVFEGWGFDLQLWCLSTVCWVLPMSAFVLSGFSGPSHSLQTFTRGLLRTLNATVVNSWLSFNVAVRLSPHLPPQNTEITSFNQLSLSRLGLVKIYCLGRVAPLRHPPSRSYPQLFT